MRLTAPLALFSLLLLVACYDKPPPRTVTKTAKTHDAWKPYRALIESKDPGPLDPLTSFAPTWLLQAEAVGYGYQPFMDDLRKDIAPACLSERIDDPSVVPETMLGCLMVAVWVEGWRYHWGPDEGRALGALALTYRFFAAARDRGPEIAERFASSTEYHVQRRDELRDFAARLMREAEGREWQAFGQLAKLSPEQRGTSAAVDEAFAALRETTAPEGPGAPPY